MTTQGILVALTAVVAGVYLARQTWRTWTASGCNKGCGCTSAKTAPAGLISAEDLTVRVKQRGAGIPTELRKADESEKSGNFLP